MYKYVPLYTYLLVTPNNSIKLRDHAILHKSHIAIRACSRGRCVTVSFSFRETVDCCVLFLSILTTSVRYYTVMRFLNRYGNVYET